MARELIHFNTRKPLTRVIAILFLIASSIGSFIVVRWYIGNTLAENFNSGDNGLEIAKFATSIAPSDPLTHWRLALVSQTRLPFDQMSQAVAEYEKAVSLSPYDYRFWTALGTAYEQAGEATKSEAALRRAVELAPSYAQPHWYLGNLLLRNNKYDEGFAELVRAAEANEELRPQLFTLLWQIYGADFNSLLNAVGTRAQTRAAFAHHLLTQRKFDEGMRMWGSLSPAEKKANKDSGDAIVTTLLNSLHYYDALSVWNDLAPDALTRATMDKMIDGSFEESITYTTDMVFAWQVKNVPQMQIGIDPHTAYSGKRSLRLVFQVRTKLEVLSASQLVPVMPDTDYELEFYMKTERLESGATPSIAVMHPTDSQVLVASEGAPNGDNDWQRVALSFKTPPKAEAVSIRIARGSCGDNNFCPIFGTVWYDDFSIKRRN